MKDACGEGKDDEDVLPAVSHECASTIVEAPHRDAVRLQLQRHEARLGLQSIRAVLCRRGRVPRTPRAYFSCAWAAPVRALRAGLPARQPREVSDRALAELVYNTMRPRLEQMNYHAPPCAERCPQLAKLEAVYETGGGFAHTGKRDLQQPLPRWPLAAHATRRRSAPTAKRRQPSRR